MFSCSSGQRQDPRSRKEATRREQGCLNPPGVDPAQFVHGHVMPKLRQGLRRAFEGITNKD
jgi:hypothetical protein